MIKYFSFLLFFIFSHANAQDYNCKDTDKLQKIFTDEPEHYFNNCACLEDLAGIALTTPKDMKLVAACYIHWNDSEKFINFQKEKVSFDTYTNGDYPQGAIFLSGKVVLKGELVYEPSDFTSDFNFYVAVPNESHSLFVNNISRVTFFDKKTEEAFRVTEETLKLSIESPACLVADATIEINGLKLLSGQTDEAGTYPHHVRVISIDSYKPCPKK